MNKASDTLRIDTCASGLFTFVLVWLQLHHDALSFVKV